MTRWWLSFVDDETDTFKGVAIVEAPDFLTAVLLSKEHGCNPGGQVMGTDFPEGHVGPENDLPLNVLLSREQLQERMEAKSLREWKEEQAKQT